MFLTKEKKELIENAERLELAYNDLRKRNNELQSTFEKVLYRIIKYVPKCREIHRRGSFDLYLGGLKCAVETWLGIFEKEEYNKELYLKVEAGKRAIEKGQKKEKKKEIKKGSFTDFVLATDLSNFGNTITKPARKIKRKPGRPRKNGKH